MEFRVPLTFKFLVVILTYKITKTICVTVRTDIGDIKGQGAAIKIAGIDFKINVFMGIPYAKPPVGDFRFRKPVPFGRFGEPFNASVAGPACMQAQGARSFPVSEDCLTLNIYTPENITIQHAVMIYIHGGGFDTGRGSDFIGTNLVLGGNVVVVTMNYRLGFFGFMGTGDSTSPGNFGLWDQRLAIQWVNSHIGHFGGNKSRVTLFGQSAGATSVLYHSLNPGNRGLFSAVISQSFSSFHWNYDGNPYMKTRRVAEKLNCDKATKADTVNCLRQIDARDVISQISTIKQNDPTPYELRFVPTQDNDIVQFPPDDLTSLSTPAYNNILTFLRSLSFLAGFNGQEGGFYTSFWPEFGTDVEAFNPNRDTMNDDLVPKSLNLFYSKNYDNAIKRMVISEYTDWSDPDSPQHLRQLLLKLIGDLEFCVPTMQLVLLHAGVAGADNDNTFVYHFTSPPDKIAIFPRPSWVTGAIHTDEMLSLIGVPSPTNWEYIMSSTMVTYWTNFAKSGNPNEPTVTSPIWPRFTTNTKEAIVLAKHLSSSNATSRYFYARETDFWLLVVPAAEKRTTDRCSQTSGGSNPRRVTISKFDLSTLLLVFAMLLVPLL